LAGLKLERTLAFIDLVEAIAWLLILLAIETIVRLQGRDIVAGALVTASRVAEFSLYTLILGFGIYWATLSHWLYLWDEIVWIGGFAAIEMNLSEWRDELRKQDGCGVAT
jgi:Na+/citrate or Na+/malate symporter